MVHLYTLPSPTSPATSQGNHQTTAQLSQNEYFRRKKSTYLKKVIVAAVCVFPPFAPKWPLRKRSQPHLNSARRPRVYDCQGCPLCGGLRAEWGLGLSARRRRRSICLTDILPAFLWMCQFISRTDPVGSARGSSGHPRIRELRRSQ